MYEAFAALHAEGYSEVLLVGTDCPALTSAHLEDGMRALSRKDLVLGPTEDGGYYLIGARKPPEALLADIPWSAEDTLARTMEELTARGLSVAQLEKLRDLDDEDDWDYHVASGHAV